MYILCICIFYIYIYSTYNIDSASIIYLHILYNIIDRLYIYLYIDKLEYLLVKQHRSAAKVGPHVPTLWALSWGRIEEYTVELIRKVWRGGDLNLNNLEPSTNLGSECWGRHCPLCSSYPLAQHTSSFPQCLPFWSAESDLRNWEGSQSPTPRTSMWAAQGPWAAKRG